MGIFGGSQQSKRLAAYDDGGTSSFGDKVGNAARGIFGGLNRFSSEVLNPTTALGQLGAYLGAASGSPLGEASLLAQKQARDDDETQSQALYRRAQVMDLIRKAQLPKTAQVGNTFGTVDEQTGAFSPTYTAPTQDPAAIREWAYRQSLTPDAQKAFDNFRKPTPYLYTPEGIAAHAQISNDTAAAGAKYRAPARTGSSLTANAIAKYKSEASAAIAAGADPAKVQQRLADLGVR